MSKRSRILGELAAGPRTLDEMQAALGGDRRTLVWSLNDCIKEGFLARQNIEGLPGYKLTDAGRKRLASPSAPADAPAGGGRSNTGSDDRNDSSVARGAVAVQEAKGSSTDAQAPDALGGQDVMGLLNVLADIRAAIGDTGKIMLGDLAAAVGEIHKRASRLDEVERQLELARECNATLDAAEKSQAEAISEIRAALPESKSVPTSKLPNLVRGIFDRWQMCANRADELERNRRSEHQAREALQAQLASARECEGLWETTMMNAIGEDGPGSVAEAIEKLKAELATEREASEALQGMLAQADTGVDVREAARGYLVRAPKRKLRVCNRGELAVQAAKAAAKNGSGYADVFALVPMGRAVRGAEWVESK